MKKELGIRDYFLFTQQSLKTFDSCPLKFRKRYLENLKWDSFPDENIRRRLEMGNDFHLLAFRYFLGIDEDMDSLNEKNDELDIWLQSLKKSFPINPGYRYYPEYKIRMAEDYIRLEANYDLIIVKEDEIEVWDWKTRSEKPGVKSTNNKRNFRDSLQTLVYMFVLKEQVKLVAGREIDYGNISMFYWQPDSPHILEEIKYSKEKHQLAREIIQNKIKNIVGYDYSTFDKVLYAKHCKYCEFNWFCNNERIDFEAIAEDEDVLDELQWDSVDEVF